ncbi:MAG: DUF4166 domain-containing protein [Methylovulum sp.]|nr:DUF4166 domain-containing protein [Methylovulum sp.]
MSDFLLQTVLGSDWHCLPRVIQRHYEVAEGRGSCLEGIMTITYPNRMLPLIGLISLCGGLIFRRGSVVHTRVEKTVPCAGLLNWQRTMIYPDGKNHYFRSQMAYQMAHELIETIGYGFGICLRVKAVNGALVYRSKGHCWQCGRFRLPLPDWLLLGTATISERALSTDEFHLDFTIRHPWWGETYSYKGNFHYC